MIAYNNEWLKNLKVRGEASQLYHDKCISKPELESIEAKFPALFYTPNFFIRVGLFILTTIILFFSFGLVALLFMGNSDQAISAMAIFFGVLSVAGLQYMIQTKKHYRSGVDDALLWIAAILIYGGISYMANPGPIANSFLAFIISFFCVIRFTNRVMVPIAYISLLGIFFFAATRAGFYGKMLVPFIMMAVSLVMYLAVTRLRKAPRFLLYESCLQIARICSLICFYVAGNYFVVRELSNVMFDLQLPAGQGIPFGWLFWIFTCAIPILYLTRGIQKKDVVLIRVGLLLIAAIVFTIKYYYHIAPIEVTMATAGILLTGIAYALSVYLKEPKYGFTMKDLPPADNLEKLEVESLVVSQTFSPEQAVADVTTFGGGSFGGAGSSGQF